MWDLLDSRDRLKAGWSRYAEHRAAGPLPCRFAATTWSQHVSILSLSYHYLSVNTRSQRHAVETIVEDAQHDLLRRAQPPTVISAEDAAELAEGYPELIASMNLDGAAIAELVGGGPVTSRRAKTTPTNIAGQLCRFATRR